MEYDLVFGLYSPGAEVMFFKSIQHATTCRMARLASSCVDIKEILVQRTPGVDESVGMERLRRKYAHLNFEWEEESVPLPTAEDYHDDPSTAILLIAVFPIALICSSLVLFVLDMLGYLPNEK
jgi:hypothetical protein